jgi:hypothetical protein
MSSVIWVNAQHARYPKSVIDQNNVRVRSRLVRLFDPVRRRRIRTWIAPVVSPDVQVDRVSPNLRPGSILSSSVWRPRASLSTEITVGTRIAACAVEPPERNSK